MKKFILLLLSLSCAPAFGFNILVTNIIRTLKSQKILIPRIIIPVGPSGAGKGTFGQFLPNLDATYEHIDSGELVRKEIREKTKIGQEIQPIYDSGQYLDGSLDKIVWEKLVRNKLEAILNQNKTPIIDGFLRSKLTFDYLNQFIENKQLEKHTFLVKLIASKDTCIKRVLTRRVCPDSKCSKLHNILLPEYNLLQELNSSNKSHSLSVELGIYKPKSNNRLCSCGAELVTRKNDTKAFAIERRAHFDQEIEPLLQSINGHYRLIEFDTECELQDLKQKYINMFLQKDSVRNTNHRLQI